MRSLQIEPRTFATSLLRPVSDAEAATLSPWPDRIAGTVPWVKPPRSQADQQREYDRPLYGDLCARWANFVAGRAAGPRHPGIVPAFLDEVRRASYAEILDHPEVYGAVDLDAYLVSVADRLYAADIELFERMYRGFIVQRVARLRAATPFETIVEIGCGTGANLLNLSLELELASIAGNDLSPSAIGFLRQVAADVGIEGVFAAGDCRDTNVVAEIVPRSGTWALLSVHTVQMIEMLGVEWFERINTMPNPPVLGIHFEPVVWPDAGFFAGQCARYAELNRYNRDFLDVLRAAEAAGLLGIVHTDRRALGTSAFAPTSVLAWSPGVCELTTT